MEEIKETVECNEEKDKCIDEKPSCDKKSKKEAKKELAEKNEKIAELEAKLSECTDKYLRTVAEYDNFRKRTQKEKESIYSDAYSDCISKILPVADNLERAVSFGDSANIAEGVKMTLNQLVQSLESLGIKEIETKTFDPNLHNAVMHVEDDQYGEGEIVEVFQKGYIKGDKVIRYAVVKVAN